MSNLEYSTCPDSFSASARQGRTHAGATQRGGSVCTPPCNTGCTFHNIPEKQEPGKKDSSPLSFRFDWYQATLEPDVEPVQVLRWAEFIGDCRMTRPLHGYDRRYDYGVAAVYSGGKSGSFGSHVQINGGDFCPRLVDSLREKFPSHRVSRVDVCLDFQGPNAWEYLSELLILTAEKFGVPTGTAGDWLGKVRGRTLYVNPRRKGKEAPTYSARLYEKGIQMRDQGGMPSAPLDWVRLEFEIHPPKHTRHLVALMTPDQLAHSSRWMRFVCDALGTLDVERVCLSTRRERPEVVDAVENMFAQYQGVICELKRDVWMSKDEWMEACGEIWDKEEFRGLPPSVIRSWYF